MCFFLARIAGGGAGFLLPQFTLTVTKDGQGTITRTEGDTTVELVSDVFAGGDEVALTATPADGWRFDRWEGDATASDPNLTVTMDSDKNVTAVFIQQVKLTITANGRGLVSVDNAGGVEVFEEFFDLGADVFLEAMPMDGWFFSRWEGAITDTNNFTMVTMDSNKTVSAVFIAIAGQRTITVVGLTGMMTIAVNGNTIKGVDRVNDVGDDLDGIISGTQVAMTVSAPGFSDSFITATIQPDGSMVGTINGSGFNNDTWTAGPVASTGFDDDASGLHTTNIQGSSGLLAVVIQNGVITGTWREFGNFGADVNGVLNGNQISLTTVTPGFFPATVTASIQSDGSWVGTINGSGFNNAPLTVQPSFFP